MSDICEKCRRDTGSTAEVLIQEKWLRVIKMFPSRRRKDTKMPLMWCALGAIVLGLSVGTIYKPHCLDGIIYLALFLMLYPPMLEVDFAGAKRVFTAPRLVIAALLMNFVVSPLLMFGLLRLFVGSSGLNLMIGIVLYSMVPGGGMAPAFTGMLKGNVNLSITISGIGSFFSLVFVPLWTEYLIGTQVTVPALLIFRQLCFIILFPLIIAVLTRRIVSSAIGERAFRSFKARIKALSGGGLCVLLFSISLVYGDRIICEPLLILSVAGPVSAFLIILFFLSWFLGKMLRSPYEDATALTLSTMAKNNAISLALASSTFGPDAALANAIAGPLVQLPILLSFVALKIGKTPAAVLQEEFRNEGAFSKP